MASIRAENQRNQPAASSSASVVPLKARAERNLWTIGLRLAAGIAFVALLIGIVCVLAP